MSYERRTERNRLADALRTLDDSQLLNAWRRAIHVHELAKPGRQYAKATKRLNVCKLIVEERFVPDQLSWRT